jgi:hypothetical protein
VTGRVGTVRRGYTPPVAAAAALPRESTTTELGAEAQLESDPSAHGCAHQPQQRHALLRCRATSANGRANALHARMRQFMIRTRKQGSDRIGRTVRTQVQPCQRSERNRLHGKRQEQTVLRVSWYSKHSSCSTRRERADRMRRSGRRSEPTTGGGGGAATRKACDPG